MDGLKIIKYIYIYFPKYTELIKLKKKKKKNKSHNYI